MKKNLLVVTERYFPEEFIINDLVGELRKHYRVTILTQNPSYPFDKIYPGYSNPLISIERKDGVRIIRGFTILGYKHSVYLKILNYLWFSVFLSFIALLVIGRVERIFIYQTGPLTLAVPAIVLRKVTGSKTVLWIQDVWPDSVFAYGFKRHGVSLALLSAFVRWVYMACTAILVSCNGFIERVRPFARNVPIIYAPNWIVEPVSESAISQDEKSRMFRYMFAGNIGKVQNLKNILLAYAILEMADLNTYLDIIGDGSYLKELKNIAKTLGLKSIEFHGRVPMGKMGSYYERSNALIISLINKPIFSLTMPSKFQAYLASKKPIIAAINGEVAELVNFYELGEVADPDNIESIALAMKKVAGYNQEKICYVANNASKLLMEAFNRTTIIKCIYSTID